MKILKGNSASPGIGYGPVHLFNPEEELIDRKKVDAAEVKTEIHRFRNAVKKSKAQLKKIYNNVVKIMGEDSALIIETQTMLLNDGQLINGIEDLIRQEQIKADWAIKKTEKKYIALFSKLSDPAFREKRNDISDILNRLLSNLKQTNHAKSVEVIDEVVLIAREIPPSQAANIMSKGRILGLVLEEGGETSHSVILAKTLGIPTLINIRDITELATGGDFAIVDSFSAELVINPLQGQLEEARIKQKKYDLYKDRLKATTRKENRTRDHHSFDIMGNIELPFEAELIKSYNANGIGLFRTEFLLGNSTIARSAVEQGVIYHNMARSFYPHPVVIRTFDIGRDKGHHLIKGTREENPSLGTMAIRLFLREKELLIIQLKAIITANSHRNIRILLPMITEIEEVVTVRKMMREIAADLHRQGHPVHMPPLGIMIEVPAAVKLIRSLKDLVDFFSIGTNDLMQYVLAVDRNNSEVSYLYNPFHPAVVQVLIEAREEIRRVGKEVTICGEMAGKVFTALMLLGMGYRSFSMVPLSIPKIKNILTSIDFKYVSGVVKKLVGFGSKKEIEEYLIEAMFRKYPRLFSNELVW